MSDIVIDLSLPAGDPQRVQTVPLTPQAEAARAAFMASEQAAANARKNERANVDRIPAHTRALLEVLIDEGVLSPAARAAFETKMRGLL